MSVQERQSRMPFVILELHHHLGQLVHLFQDPVDMLEQFVDGVVVVVRVDAILRVDVAVHVRFVERILDLGHPGGLLQLVVQKHVPHDARDRTVDRVEYHVLFAVTDIEQPSGGIVDDQLAVRDAGIRQEPVLGK